MLPVVAERLVFEAASMPIVSQVQQTGYPESKVMAKTGIQVRVDTLMSDFQSVKDLREAGKKYNVQIVLPTVHPNVSSLDDVRTGEILHYCSDTNPAAVTIGGYTWRRENGEIGEFCRNWQCGPKFFKQELQQALGMGEGVDMTRHMFTSNMLPWLEDNKSEGEAVLSSMSEVERAHLLKLVARMHVDFLNIFPNLHHAGAVFGKKPWEFWMKQVVPLLDATKYTSPMQQVCAPHPQRVTGWGGAPIDECLNHQAATGTMIAAVMDDPAIAIEVRGRTDVIDRYSDYVLSADAELNRKEKCHGGIDESQNQRDHSYGGSKENQKQQDRRHGGSDVSQKQRDRSYGGSEMSQKQRDRRHGGSEVSQKQRDHRTGGSKESQKLKDSRLTHNSTKKGTKQTTAVQHAAYLFANHHGLNQRLPNGVEGDRIIIKYLQALQRATYIERTGSAKNFKTSGVTPSTINNIHSAYNVLWERMSRN